MTLDDITNFCEFKDCTVSFGSVEAGYVTADGNGIQSHFNNYRRFLAHNELASLPDPRHVLQAATDFKIEQDGELRSLTRQEFEAELKRFQQLVEI